MDAFDLFRKLGAGAKFDFKRFGKDAERFKVVRSQEKDVSDLYAIDFFGTGVTHGNQEKRGAEEEEGEEEGEVDAVAGKRKREDEVKTAKKKNKDGQAETEDRKSKGLKVGRDGDKTSMKRLQHLHQEKVNRVRAQHRINVHGCDVPDPVCTFSELQSEYDLNPRVLQNLALVISPTRELASQTHRELVRLSEGVGFRVHILDKASMAAKKYGPSSNKKYDVEQWCRLNLDNLVSVNIGHRNSAVETVEQELLFVGTENGKLLAVRDIIKK
ncbi:unnamed protein product, partial [Coregonus sp. 'balchen']